MDRQKLRVQQSHKLQLSPQLKQAVSLLQLSSADLDRAVEEALAENPLLEKSDAETGDNDVTAEPAVLHRRQQDEIDEHDWLAAVAYEPDFYDSLHRQVCEISRNERQSALLHLLIESLDEHGYLSDDLNVIVDNTPIDWRLSVRELKQIHALLQQFDPPGVGATDPQNSLVLQIKRLPGDAVRDCALTVVRDHFELLSRPNPGAKLRKSLKCAPEILDRALNLILRLNPYPSNGFNSAEQTVYVIPDVRVFKKDGEWTVRGEAHLRPRLTVNPVFEQAVRLDNDRTWKEKLADAKMWIQNIEWRENTILQVARAIVEHQRDFFELGRAALAPLNMTRVAAELHISTATVSRSVNQKYLLCPQGLFELRFFFSKNSDGSSEGMSSTAVKSHIGSWIRGEDPHSPLSDDDLRRKLNTVGIDISRRTVAKYREAMNIPSVYYRRKSRGR